jgi:predicted Zn-dependent peptidase
MFWEFIDTGEAEFASASAAEYEGAGVTVTYMSCDPDDVTDNVTRLHEMQLQIECDGVTEEELELAKSKVMSQVVRRAERPANRLFTVGNNWLQRGIYRSLQDSVASYRNVTTGQVQTSLARFPMSRQSTVMAGPLTEEQVGRCRTVMGMGL